MKFEAARIHFLDDVFDTVVKLPIDHHRCRHCKTWKNSFGDPPFTLNIFLPGPSFEAIFFGMAHPQIPSHQLPPPHFLPDKKWVVPDFVV